MYLAVLAGRDIAGSVKSFGNIESKLLACGLVKRESQRYQTRQSFCSDAVVGEDFRDVSPGFLPRTLEEMRAGRVESELAEREARQREERQREEISQAPQSTGPSLEDTLDRLFEDAAQEESNGTSANTTMLVRERNTPATRTNVHAQSMNPTRSREYRARQIAALRRELQRMRNGIERVMSGLRSLGETVPDHTDATGRLMELGRTLDSISGTQSPEDAQRAVDSADAQVNRVQPISQQDRSLAGIHARVRDARLAVDEARRNRDQAASELDLAEQEFRSSQSTLRQLQRDEQTAENYTRLFGTLEEMLAQGENYESPIGAMFMRADERFHVAEEVRREEQTLRQVLANEAMASGPESNNLLERLSEFSSRERDVWGVPRDGNAEVQPPLQAVNHSDGLQAPEVRDSGIGAVRQTQPDSASIDGLEEYNAMLQGTFPEASLGVRDQDRALEAPTNPDGPLNMTIVNESNGFHPTSAQPIVLAGPPGQQLDPDPSENNDRGLDAQYALRALLGSETLRLPLNGRLNVDQIQRLRCGVEENSLTVTERATIQDLLETPAIVWGTGLPSERNYRRRRRGEEVTFTPDAFDMARGGLVTIHDVEIMAECFQMSGELRWRSELSSVEQWHTLRRLQRGERNPTDRDVLFRMVQNEATLNLARDLQSQVSGGSNQDQANRQAELDRDRQERARHGDFSRAELNAQRRATHAFALAAGRSAMQTGSTVLLQQMANQGDASRAAYQRLRDNGYMTSDNLVDGIMRYRPLSLDDFTAAPSASDSGDEHESDNEARGLDAQDSGRPQEPMTDEEMTMKLDCRICYMQLADIACLPCGHLVMCRWCSEQHSPVMAHDRTRPRRPAGCPVCRKGIRQKVRMFRA